MIPKFKAYVPYENQVLDVKEINFSKGNVVLYEQLRPSRYSLFNEVILMQYLNLKDRNNDEIYSDYIVKMKWDIYSDYEYFHVISRKGYAPRLMNKNKGIELWLRNEDCEIVGNIHQHAHLLGDDYYYDAKELDNIAPK